jgi:CRP-like cAMP-binding protein
MKGIQPGANCFDCEYNCMRKDIFTDENTQSINENKKDITFSRNDTIIKQGSFISHIFYLKTGIVKLLIESENNKQVILEIIPPGTFIGLSVLHFQEFFPFTIVAVNTAKICQIKKEIIQEITRTNQDANNYLISGFTDEMLYLYKRIAVLSTRNNHGKLADSLLYLNQPEFQNENIHDYLTRKDIAELAAISVESANKILKEFHHDRIIQLNGKHISINDIDLLKRLSKIG